MKLYSQYHSEGLEILAFPCNQFGKQEPGTNQEIREFVNGYNVTFPMFAKIKVNGSEAHPIFRFLRYNLTGLLGSSVKWNFTKFLVDRKGKPVKRYAPATKPLSLEKDIVALLNESE